MIRWAGQMLVFVVFAVACAATFQQPHDGAFMPAPHEETTLGRMLMFGGLVLSRDAKNQSDSAWLWSYRNRKEAGMCAAPGSFAYGVAMNGRPFFIIGAFISAKVAKADSLYVIWAGTVCGDSLPSWHSHIVDNETRYAPSPCDIHAATKRPRVPFHLQVGDTNRIRVYSADQAYTSDVVNWCGAAFQNGLQ